MQQTAGEEENHLPLHGVRVLDLTRVLAGPLATQMLGDLGAEVIKVEAPSGDEIRQITVQLPDGKRLPSASPMFLSSNRNKKSITVDLSQPEGQEIVRGICKTSNIFVENFRVGNLKKYGLDYDSLSSVNDRLIYCSITGYGQSGPYADRPGYDAIFQAFSGFMSSIGYPADHPLAGPQRSGISIMDFITGAHAATGVLAAYIKQLRNPAGPIHIDTSLLDCSLAAMSHYAVQYLMTGVQPPKRGTAGNGGVPTQAFSCRDGSIMISVGNDKLFRSFCAAVDLPDISDDARFKFAGDRNANRSELIPIIEAHMLTWERKILLDRLVEAGVPAGLINEFEDVFADPQVLARATRVEVDDPRYDLEVLRNPLHLGDLTFPYRAPPTVGEHTREVLQRLLKYSDDQIEALRKRGVI